MHFIRKAGAICVATLVVMGVYFLAGAVAVEASPAAPNVVKTFTQPDGTTHEFRLWGDEFANGWETLDGYTVAWNEQTGFWEYAVRDGAGRLVPSGIVVGQRAPAAAHLRPSLEAINALRAEEGVGPVGQITAASPPAWAGSDTDVLFLMVEFTDVACTFTDAQMQANLFGTAASGPGNLYDYYWEISRGNLALDGRVEGGATGCYTLANNHTHYDQGPGDHDSLVAEAIALADADVDFSIYDNDGDGQVDSLGIIYAGGGPHDGCETDDGANGPGGDELWPHSGSISAVSVDGVNVVPYIIQSEITWGVADGVCDEQQTIGLFAHEFGHALGLPDYYDTDNSSEGVGFWSAMASQFLSTVNLADTPPHFDPYSKWWLGWLTPTDYTGLNVGEGIPQVETTGFVAQFLPNPGGPEQGGTGEYFLVENRQQVGFDSQLPGCGVLIWHIEESMTHNQNEGHTTASHRLLDLEEADGLDELDSTGDRGDAGDPYPGSTLNRFFDGTTYPHSNYYDGTPTGVRIADISDCAPMMSANFGNPTIDLYIEKTDSPDPVLAGGQLSYNITVWNYGPGYATNVTVIDTLPLGVEYQTDTDSCVVSLGTGPSGEDQVICDLGNMMPAEARTFTIVGSVDPGLVANNGGPTTLINTVTVDADQPDSNPGTNTATATTVVNEEADVWVTKDCKPDDPMYVGDTATCTIKVGNAGPSTARNVTTVDEFLSNGTFEFGVPSTTAGTCFASANPQPGFGTVTCDLGDVDPGAVVTIKITVTAAEPQNINDEVHVTSDTPDPNQANNWATDEVNILEAADLEVFKECKPDGPIWAGLEATCSIRVKNWGPSTAASVSLADDHVSDGTFNFGTVTTTASTCSFSPNPLGGEGIVTCNFGKVTTTAGTCTFTPNPQVGAGTVTCDLGDMAPGDEVTVVVPLSADEGMDINDTALASSPTFDPDTDNNSASDGVTVTPIADLALTKTATPSPVIAGNTLTYDLQVTNNGPSTAVNVVIGDVLPDGVAIQTVTASAGACNAGVPGDAGLRTTCTFDSLAPGDSETMEIVVLVDPSVLGILGNNAEVYSDTYDPDNSNNLATTATTINAEADLSVTKVDFPDPVVAGGLLTYDLTVANAGPSTAVDVTLTDLLPSEVSFVGYTVSNGTGTCVLLPGPPDTVECDLQDLLPGQSVTVVIDVLVDPSVPHGTVIQDQAFVSSATTDPGPGNSVTEDTTVLAEADLALTKDASFLSENPSRRIQYTLVINNNGSSDAQGVILVDTLPLTPKKIVYVMDSGNGACLYDEGTHTVTCDFGTVAAGEVVTLEIIVDARGSVLRITNVADVTAATADPDLSNNHAVKEIQVKGGPGPSRH